jgi:hypothetical protein
MSDTTLAAVIGLIGTLFGALIVAILGLRKWQQEQRLKKREDYQKKRAVIYQELWDLLPDLSGVIEASNIAENFRKTDADKNSLLAGMYGLQASKLLLPDVPAIKQSHNKANVFMLKNAIYIDKRHRQLTNQYLEELIDAKEELSQTIVSFEDDLRKAIIDKWAEIALQNMENTQVNMAGHEADNEIRGFAAPSIDKIQYPRRPLGYDQPKPSRRPLIPPAPELDDEDNKPTLDQASIVHVTEVSKEGTIPTAVDLSPSSEHISDETVSNAMVSDGIPIDPDIPPRNSILHKVGQYLKMQWVGFAMSKPTRLRLQLTEIFVPEMKQSCRTLRDLMRAVATFEKLQQEFNLVVSGE